MKRLLFLLFLGLVFLYVELVSAVEPISFISDTHVQHLQEQFKSAKPANFEQVKGEWDCTLYGMRSRIAKKDQSSFYNFSFEDAVVKNKGAQIVRSYSADERGLVGENGPLIDIVRIDQKGQIISEMSLPNRNTAANSSLVSSAINSSRNILTYSLCRRN